MKESKFDKLYRRIVENITTTSAGVGATNPDQMSGDTYASGDARVPLVLGARDKKRKKRKIPVITRNFPTGL
jgi:hypothetical protein